MSRPENRSQLMDRLGAVQRNTVWSWCAVDERNQKVYFSVWVDSVHKNDGKNRYKIQEPWWGINEGSGRKSAARNDHDEKLSLVFNHEYEPLGYFIQAKDPTANPREIAETRTSFVMRLRLEWLEDGSVVGTPVERINIA